MAGLCQKDEGELKSRKNGKRRNRLVPPVPGCSFFFVVSFIEQKSE